MARYKEFDTQPWFPPIDLPRPPGSFGHPHVDTTMFYTRVLNRRGVGGHSPLNPFLTFD